MKKKICFFIFILTLFFSCKYKYVISITPEDAEITLNGVSSANDQKTILSIDNPILESKKRGYKNYSRVLKKSLPFIDNKINVTMEKEIYDVEIGLLDGTSDIYLGDKYYGVAPQKIKLESGIYEGHLKRDNFPDEKIRIECFSNMKLIFRHKKESVPFRQMGIFKCGVQPKQVIFSPDNKKILIPLLGNPGFELFDLYNYAEKNIFISPPDITKDSGYAEGLFIDEKGVFLVSQMTTGNVYEYDYNDLSYKRTIKTGGLYPKIIAYSKKHSILAVSNWVSGNVSIIDYETGKVLKKVKTAKAPRGLVFTSDENFLYAADYDGGTISKITTDDWSIVNTVNIENGCMRHILITKDDKYLYVSDMFNFNILKIDAADLSVIKKYRVFYNPNTIDISKDEKYLFVSCRGPNSKEGYLTRSPVNGRVEIIDLELGKKIYSFEAGNQTTGLDIDDTGNYLCFSNFRDDNIEIYYLNSSESATIFSAKK